MATHPRTMRLHASRHDVAASRHLLEDALRLRAVGEDAKSISYDAGDVVLMLDWGLDHTATAVENTPRREVVLLVDEIDAVRAALEARGVRCDPSATDVSFSFAVAGGPRFVLLCIADECLMWPSVGWRAGPSAVVRLPPRSAG
ncbi:hypothetical protein AB0M36_23800 [Actinoplanes sp. NPDC051346]|uniref:VOC family protein n=1 Tax=Actinoplanes sp. NPDC051346 TaxID=3155048 RepID=UPI00341B8F91